MTMIQVEISLEYFEWTSDVATDSDLNACNIKYKAAFEGHSLGLLVSQYSHQILIREISFLERIISGETGSGKSMKSYFDQPPREVLQYE